MYRRTTCSFSDSEVDITRLIKGNNYIFQTHDIPGSNKKLAIVMIDMIILGGAVPDSEVEEMLELLPTASSAQFDKRMFQYEGPGPKSQVLAEGEWQWIEWTPQMYSEDESVQWIFVAGHYTGSIANDP